MPLETDQKDCILRQWLFTRSGNRRNVTEWSMPQDMGHGLLGTQHRPWCGGVSPPSLFTRSREHIRRPTERHRQKPPCANTDHVFM